MNSFKLDYEMNSFDEENVNQTIRQLNINANGYIMSMTRPSMLKIALIGNIAEFANRTCIICFSETELNLIMLSRISNKKVTEVIKIPRNEIKSIKLSNILISYMLRIKCGNSKIKFQVFKKFAKFPNVKNQIELFKRMYNL